MQNTNATEQGIRQLVRHTLRHPARWLLPTLIFGGLGLAYALVHQPDWEASQALTVREDYAESTQWSGQFNEAEQLKHAQETFLELARSHSVITAALKTVGPPASCSQSQPWPAAEDVAAMRDKTEVLAPNGMEFGTTRMFYLNVADPDPQRAVLLASAICDESEKRFKQMRDQEMQDAIAELTNTVSLASQELVQETATLQKMETAAGSDLAELRMLSESFAGGSNLQTTLAELRQELRRAESSRSANQQLLELLTAAQQNPANLVATPNQLLESQPALRRLKEGLIDAQLNSSRLLGTMSPEHPRVKAATVAESEIRGHLHRELALAVRGLGAEQSLIETQINALSDRTSDLRQRLQKLAEMRASYSNQLAEVRQQTTSLTNAQQELNATRASLAAGDVVTLVTRIDGPQIGPFPQGPGRSVIAAAGCAGGLLIGLGLLVLTLPTPVQAIEPVPVQDPVPTQETVSQPTVPSPAPASQITPPTPTVRPPMPMPVPLPVAAASGHSMTLKEALVRCNGGTNSWK